MTNDAAPATVDWRNRVLVGATRALSLVPGGNRAAPPRNILVVRLGNLGDIVVTLPVFHALRRRFPDARMTLLTSPTKRGAPDATQVLEKDSTFDETIAYYDDESGKPAFLRRLRSRIRALQIDLAVVLPGGLSRLKNLAKHFVLLASCDVRRIAGLQSATPEQRPLGQTGRLIGLLEQIPSFGTIDIEPFPWIRVGDDDEAFARERLAACGDGPIVGMQCGAKRPANRWMPERFAEVARRLVKQCDAAIILTGSPSEREAVEHVQEAIGARCLNLAGETSVVQLAAVARRCAVFVSNDTGAMHVAAAMGAPAVAVFSARDDAFRWYPYGDGHTVLRKDIECSPCLEDTCPLYDFPECLARISVDEVVRAVRYTLDTK